MRILLKLALTICVPIAICIAILWSGVGSKKIHFISQGNLTSNSTRTPATLVGVFNLYPPYFWWAKERGLMEAQLWVGDDSSWTKLVICKIVPSYAEAGIFLQELGGEVTGMYVPAANQILLKKPSSTEPELRFEGECKPFQPLFLLE